MCNVNCDSAQQCETIDATSTCKFSYGSAIIYIPFRNDIGIVHTSEKFNQFKVIIMLVQTEFALLSIIFLFENCFACWPWLYVDNVVLTPVRRRSVRSLTDLDGKLIFCTHTKNSAIIPILILQHSY